MGQIAPSRDQVADHAAKGSQRDLRRWFGEKNDEDDMTVSPSMS